jgi:hypothetical protein
MIVLDKKYRILTYFIKIARHSVVLSILTKMAVDNKNVD